MPLTSTQLDAFHREGFIIVTDLFDPAQMRAALVEMERIFYGNSFVEYMVESDATEQSKSIEPVPTKAVPHYGDTEYGRPQFPT